MLKDEWVNVRIYAVTSLGKLGDEEAVPALIEVLKNSQENELVRAGAAAALGVLRDSRALLPLREIIMNAEELGELEDTALKAFKKIMAPTGKMFQGLQTKKPFAVVNSQIKSIKSLLQIFCNRLLVLVCRKFVDRITLMFFYVACHFTVKEFNFKTLVFQV